MQVLTIYTFLQAQQNVQRLECSLHTAFIVMRFPTFLMIAVTFWLIVRCTQLKALSLYLKNLQFLFYQIIFLLKIETEAWLPHEITLDLFPDVHSSNMFRCQPSLQISGLYISVIKLQFFSYDGNMPDNFGPGFFASTLLWLEENVMFGQGWGREVQIHDCQMFVMLQCCQMLLCCSAAKWLCHPVEEECVHDKERLVDLSGSSSELVQMCMNFGDCFAFHRRKLKSN